MKILALLLLCSILAGGCSHINTAGSSSIATKTHQAPRQQPPLADSHSQNADETARQQRFAIPRNAAFAALCPRDGSGTEVGAELDSDLDGILDRHDECPATPEDIAVDATGCPLSLFLSLSIPFQSSQTLFSGEQLYKIQQIARLLKNNPHSHIILSGHSDNSGNSQTNMVLSEKRAQNIKETLVHKYGIDALRIAAKGYGDSRPLVSNKTLKGRERNRRVDVVLNGYYSTHTSYVALRRPYKIQFEANQTELSDALHEQVASLGAYLKQNQYIGANISGYTDSSGTVKTNMTLSVLRAQKVKQYLMNTYGIAPERLLARGYGQSNPIADNATKQGRRLNRRVTITLNKLNTVPATPSRINSAVILPQPIGTAPTPLDRQFDIRFEKHTAQLGDLSKETVDAIGDLMRSKPDMRIVIEGHAAGLPEGENHRISQARAQNVKTYLQQRYNIDSNRLHTIGYGSDLTNTANASKEGNRVHIRLNRF